MKARAFSASESVTTSPSLPITFDAPRSVSSPPHSPGAPCGAPCRVFPSMSQPSRKRLFKCCMMRALGYGRSLSLCQRTNSHGGAQTARPCANVNHIAEGSWASSLSGCLLRALMHGKGTATTATALPDWPHSHAKTLARCLWELNHEFIPNTQDLRSKWEVSRCYLKIYNRQWYARKAGPENSQPGVDSWWLPPKNVM